MFRTKQRACRSAFSDRVPSPPHRGDDSSFSPPFFSFRWRGRLFTPLSPLIRLYFRPNPLPFSAPRPSVIFHVSLPPESNRDGGGERGFGPGTTGSLSPCRYSSLCFFILYAGIRLFCRVERIALPLRRPGYIPWKPGRLAREREIGCERIFGRIGCITWKRSRVTSDIG